MSRRNETQPFNFREGINRFENNLPIIIALVENTELPENARGNFRGIRRFATNARQNLVTVARTLLQAQNSRIAIGEVLMGSDFYEDVLEEYPNSWDPQHPDFDNAYERFEDLVVGVEERFLALLPSNFSLTTEFNYVSISSFQRDYLSDRPVMNYEDEETEEGPNFQSERIYLTAETILEEGLPRQVMVEHPDGRQNVGERFPEGEGGI